MSHLSSDQEAIQRANRIRVALPEGGLFHEKSWRISPDPFHLPSPIAEEIEKLGYRLTLFVKACNLLYRLSCDGRRPSWIAELLDRGKPPELIAYQRERAFANELPRVIRPDVILTEDGYIIAELDNVPGGIGLTAWLNEAYTNVGSQVLGGIHGMLEGFRSILPEGGDILVSQEAATYRPEMEWLSRRLNDTGDQYFRVLTADLRKDWQPHVYRFFENFDLKNVPAAEALKAQVLAGKISVTPPFKPALEEKLWFALFWVRPLEAFWLRELGERTLRALRKVIPYTWIVDPTPLPAHAVLPHLEIQNWMELAQFSQKQRDFILKVSGFSERAWGSRGVIVARDISQQQWAAALQAALAEFSVHPWLLQKFHKGRLVEQTYIEADGTLQILRGRVRLCPYYFVQESQTILGGALATIVPADKKLIHGMSTAILTPAAAI
ncbi:MAG: hypothetical protein C5B47_03010 [Verrucomicrobia bacterium]|nr:MAG: hypothetical protein C5B47_03010 [Verrucomicrobiota bacterium]